jgi:hypothetical protein
MRKPVTIRIHERVIAAVNAAAVQRERSFDRVIEDILCVHFGITDIQDDVDVICKLENPRSIEWDKNPNRTEAENEKMAKIFDTLLDKAGY